MLFRSYEVAENISNFDISPDGKKIGFISRGKVFVSDIEGKFIKQINASDSERATEIIWTDNKTLVLSKTLNGYTNFYAIAADGTGNPKQLTTDTRNNRSIVYNKKRTMAVFLSGRDKVRLLDLKTLQSKIIAKEDIWGFQNSTPGFSPNDEYVVFTAYKNFEQDIFIHHIKENKTINLTNTGITEADPIWSADGKYIYFTSQRLKAAYPFGMPNSHIYRLALEKIEEPYRIDKFDELFKEEKKDTSKKQAVKTDSLVKINIDFDMLMERVQIISPSVGQQNLLGVYSKAEKTTVLYTSDHGEGRNAIWKTTLEPFEATKTEKIVSSSSEGYGGVVEANDKLYTILGGNINKVNIESNTTTPINISLKFRCNLNEEFNQMFYETWAQMDENFYDENFHGVDWIKLKNQYAQFLPYLNTRADIRVLLNDLLGELNSSHQGFNTFGEDEKIVLRNLTMETGIVFENENPYKIKTIVKRSAADKKAIDIIPGDVLVKVNNETLDITKDRNSYFIQSTP